MNQKIRFLFCVLASLGIFLITGCNTIPIESSVHVRKGMERSMVHALLGEPNFANLDGLEELYIQNNANYQKNQAPAYKDNPNAQQSQTALLYRELHVRYNNGGLVEDVFQRVTLN
jgi:hypothetical protein